MLPHNLPSLIVEMQVKDAYESLEMVDYCKVIRFCVKTVQIRDILSVPPGAV